MSTFVLTNLPAQVPQSSVSTISNLKDFIASCATEARIAVLKATTDYSLPPGKARQQAERDQARKLFSLRTIVLEVSPEPDLTEQRGWKHTRQRLNAIKSSTGDRDSEALWAASENDFSFFGEDGEQAAECGIYEQEPEKYYPTIPFSDEKVFVGNNSPSLTSPRPVTPVVSQEPSRAAAISPTFSGSNTLVARNDTILQSPRNLPLGRNHRNSNDLQREQGPATTIWSAAGKRGDPNSAPAPVEVSGTVPQVPWPTPRPQPPAQPTKASPLLLLDVVAEVAKWRHERRAAYEAELQRRQRAGLNSRPAERLADADIYVEGHWTGEVKVIRNAQKLAPGKLERSGKVDIYGNYFEGGYLYP